MKNKQTSSISDFKRIKNGGYGKLITNKLESKESQNVFKLNFEDQRPNSVATAASKHQKAHSQLNNFLMEPNEIPEQSESELTAKSEKIQFIYQKLGSKQKFEEYLTQRRADIIRESALTENDETDKLNDKGKLYKNSNNFLGVLVYTSGTKYEGDFQDGVPHGRGRVEFKNGGWYEGQFFEGFMQGKGKFYAPF